MSFDYPDVRRDETCVEDLHGHQVADPYRWLENPSSSETHKFIELQNKVSQTYIDACPHKSDLLASLEHLVVYDKWQTPSEYGGAYYYFYNSRHPQSIFYRLENLDSVPSVVLDVNEIARAEGAEEGSIGINTMAMSKEGKYLSYGLSRKGSDWVEVSVKDLASGKDLKDKLKWVKFSGLPWTHDQLGFFYTNYPKPTTIGDDEDQGTETDSNTHSRLYYHHVGASQDDDRHIYSDNDHPENMFYATVSTDGHYVLVFVSDPKEPGRLVKIARLGDDLGLPESNLDFAEITHDYAWDVDFITNYENLFYFKLVHKDHSPRGKVVVWDVNNLDAGCKEVIAEHPSDVLESVVCVDHDKIVVTYLHDVKHVMHIAELATGAEIVKVELPLGTISMLSGKKTSSEFFFKVVTYLSPGIVYRYDLTAPPESRLSVFRKSSPPEGFNPDDFITTQKWYASKDGTMIPIFITHAKDIVLDGDNPTLLSGYGGFQIPLLPNYNDRWIAWLSHYRKAVVAVANLRGGAEFGEDWHRGGMLERKQNVFDDFQWAAQWLIETGYTKTERLGIYGRSNGGLLVGAVLNQAPHLFGAAIPSVGVMDMLRFHKFTIGSHWRVDYGDPDTKEDFEYIFKYSPYHNIRAGLPYPPTLVMTSDHDDRVVPLHSLKYAAQLQHAVKNTPGHKNPALIYIETGGGHGGAGSKALNKVVVETSIELSFLSKTLGAEFRT